MTSAEKQTPVADIQLTQEAISEIKRLLVEHELPESAGVRVGVKGGGCSGFAYTLNFDFKPADGDIIMEEGGVRICCDPKSILYLNGARLTYSDGLQGKGFQFENPNAANTCGCGDSFSV